jgi:hypothetical protein
LRCLPLLVHTCALDHAIVARLALPWYVLEYCACARGELSRRPHAAGGRNLKCRRVAWVGPLGRVRVLANTRASAQCGL